MNAGLDAVARDEGGDDGHDLARRLQGASPAGRPVGVERFYLVSDAEGLLAAAGARGDPQPHLVGLVAGGELFPVEGVQPDQLAADFLRLGDVHLYIIISFPPAEGRDQGATPKRNAGASAGVWEEPAKRIETVQLLRCESPRGFCRRELEVFYNAWVISTPQDRSAAWFEDRPRA